ncbi:MAG: helix-turn-helix transcriptional regulator [Clostridia bacterium]|nr:helix-turn-helix transcriptional regulator [Clostridia bacterium]
MPKGKQRFRNRLFILRKCATLSQDEVCESVGVTKRTLYNYEHCILPIPSDKLMAFARLYRCSTDHILYFDDEKAVGNETGNK